MKSTEHEIFPGVDIMAIAYWIPAQRLVYIQNLRYSTSSTVVQQDKPIES